jgi:hypothetical protein
MRHRVLTIILLTGLGLSITVLTAESTNLRLPNNHQGYAPVQPIDYSHRLHAGELGIDCRYCHTAAEYGRHAGIPNPDVCMNCHKYVTSSFNVLQTEMTQADAEQREPRVMVSDELQKLYDYLGLADPKQEVTSETAGIPWVRVHNLPDYVVFDHRAHVAAGVTCQKCHGPVESMERVRQVESLSMGWCVECHRESTANGIDGRTVNASIDCSTCHY